MKLDRALVGMLAIIVPAKVLLMLVGQRYVDGDEAVIGVMAMHIARGAEFPFFFWGQPYGGGGALEAYMAVVPFSIFGPSSLGLRFSVLVLSFTALVLTYSLVKRLEGQQAAILCTVLAATTSGLVEWFSKSRGGYVETSLIMLLILDIVFRIQTAPKASLWRPCLVGLLCGVSYYIQELALPFIALTAMVLVFACADKRPAASLAAFTLGALIAFSPLLAYNYSHNWANFAYIRRAAEPLAPSLGRIAYALTKRFPFLFQPPNFDGVPLQLGWQARAEAAVWLTLAGVAGVSAIGRWLRGSRLDLVQATLAAYVFLFLPYALLSRRADTSPRYYFTLYIPIIILSGIWLARRLHAPGTHATWQRFGAAFCALFLIASGLWTHGNAFRTNYVTDDVWTGARSESRRTDGADLIRVIDYLRRNDIDAVRSPYFSAWRIVFESDEQILASSAGLQPGAMRYPAFDEEVRLSLRVAWVLHCDSLHNDALPSSRRRRFGDFCVYL